MGKLTLSPHCCSRRARAAAHRAMALAALASDSSTQVRYRRYQAHMRKAEALALTADLVVYAAPQEVES